MLKATLYALTLIASTPLLHAQKVYSASRRESIQVGFAGSSYSLDYGEGREKGFTIFGDIDLSHHLGAEVLYRNASIDTPGDIGENHLLAGPRGFITRGRFTPYLKGLAGLGTINFQQGTFLVDHSEHYFIFALGGGLDIRATQHIVVRAIDYEYQIWPTFKPNGLSPTGFSVGVAYKF